MYRFPLLLIPTPLVLAFFAMHPYFFVNFVLVVHVMASRYQLYITHALFGMQALSVLKNSMDCIINII